MTTLAQLSTLAVMYLREVDNKKSTPRSSLHYRTLAALEREKWVEPVVSAKGAECQFRLTDDGKEELEYGLGRLILLETQPGQRGTPLYIIRIIELLEEGHFPRSTCDPGKARAYLDRHVKAQRENVEALAKLLGLR